MLFIRDFQVPRNPMHILAQSCRAQAALWGFRSVAQEQLGETNYIENSEKRVGLFPKRAFDEPFASQGVGVVCFGMYLSSFANVENVPNEMK